jgi:hypothetical protein
MPIEITHSQTTFLIRRAAFEARGLSRAFFDESLTLTADEFRVEGDLIAVGPIPSGVDVSELIAELEEAGVIYFEDFFDLSGNWPEWLSVFAMARR